MGGKVIYSTTEPMAAIGIQLIEFKGSWKVLRRPTLPPRTWSNISTKVWAEYILNYVRFI